MKTDNLEFYQTDIQGELEVWRDKNTGNVFYVPIKVVRDFGNLSVCNIKKWSGVKKWARQCDVTGEGMNNGWLWGDGDFYVKNQDDAMNECWKDRYQIRDDLFSLIDVMKLDNMSKRFQSKTMCKIDTIVNYYKDVLVVNYRDKDLEHDKLTGRLPNLVNLVVGFELDVLLKIFMLDNMYYTEWECEDDYQYVEIDGKLIAHDGNI